MKNIIAFSILTIIILLFGSAAYIQTSALQNQNEKNIKIVETKSLLLSLQNLSNQAYNQASVYVLTKNPDNLAAFNKAKKEIKAHYSQLISKKYPNSNLINESMDLSAQTLATIGQIILKKTFTQQEANILVLTLEMNKVTNEKLNKIYTSLNTAPINYQAILQLILIAISGITLINSIIFFAFLKPRKNKEINPSNKNLQLDIVQDTQSFVQIPHANIITSNLQNAVRELQACENSGSEARLHLSLSLESIIEKNERIKDSLANVLNAFEKMPFMIEDIINHVSDHTSRQHLMKMRLILEKTLKIMPFYIKTMNQEKEKAELSTQVMDKTNEINHKKMKTIYATILEQENTPTQKADTLNTEMKLCA